METLLKIVTGVLIGTSLMTLCSYFFANLLNKQFREPVLLQKLLELDKPQVPPIIGWLLHYSVGLLFVVIYHLIWLSTAAEPSAQSGILLGLFSGLIGVSGWYFVFRFHSEPPPIDFKAFYEQLIVVHLMFGLGATLGYLLI